MENEDNVTKSMTREEYIRREVQKGIDEVKRGECAPWDLQATRAEAHRRYAERHKTS
ncbi:MAG: hypothetical protein WD065_20195 [Planctomycetaceae bacterium]